MNAPLGTDRYSQLGHPVGVPAANVADVTKPAERQHGDETQGPADAGCPGAEKRAEIAALERKRDGQIAGNRSGINARADGAAQAALHGGSKRRRRGERAWSLPSTS